MKKTLTLLAVVAIALLASTPSAYSRPEAPSLLTPFNGARMQTFSPTLRWSVPEGATVTQVHFQVIPYQRDGPGVDLILSPNQGEFTLPAPPDWYGLLPDMSYNWRVRASDATTSIGVDDDSWSDWSRVWEFRTPALNAATIQLQSPTGDVQVETATPTLLWTDIEPNSWYYEVQLSTDPLFGNNAFRYWELRHGAVTDPPRSYAVPEAYPLAPGERYFWRVRQRVQGNGVPLEWTVPASFYAPGGSGAPVTTPAPPGVPPTLGPTTAQVTDIKDGGTIEVNIDGVRKTVRYLGIDVPKVSPPECYGAQAAAKNSELVEGQFVELEPDVTDTDADGNLLRYVYIDGLLVNGELVRGGYARVSTDGPDSRYRDEFQDLQEEAQEEGRGLWQQCDVGADAAGG